MPTIDNSRVIIIGAGLGGLALAQTLRKQGVPFAIFERDASAADRAQGWALGLSWILEPLRSSIILDDKPPLISCVVNAALGLEKCAGGDGTNVYNGYTGELIQANLKKIDDVEEYRVNRKKLRNWLLIGLVIQWGKKFVRYEEDQDGVQVYFADGTSVRGAVVVGADGVSSTIRAQLFAHQPEKIHPTCLPFTIWASAVKVTPEEYKALSTIAPTVIGTVGSNSLLLSAIIDLHPSYTAEYLWFLSIRDDEEAAKQTRGESDGREWMVKQNNKTWSERKAEATIFAEKCYFEPVKKLVLDIKEEEYDIYPIFLREVKLDEIPKGKVTLLGDAAHAMSIFHGVGGNHAMLDGIKLGNAIGKLYKTNSEPTKDGLQSVLGDYASEMLQRGRKEMDAARESTFARHMPIEDWEKVKAAGLRKPEKVET